MKSDIENVMQTLKNYYEFLIHNADDIHRELKRRYGTRKPIPYTKVGGLIISMYPHEEIVSDFLTINDVSLKECASTSAEILTHRVGALDNVDNQSCDSKYYRVYDKLPDKKILYVLEVHCSDSESVRMTIEKLGKIDVLFLNPFKSIFTYFFNSYKESEAWENFEIARGIPGNQARLDTTRDLSRIY